MLRYLALRIRRKNLLHHELGLLENIHVLCKHEILGEFRVFSVAHVHETSEMGGFALLDGFVFDVLSFSNRFESHARLLASLVHPASTASFALGIFKALGIGKGW